MTLENKTAVITGGATGIGQAIAIAFAEQDRKSTRLNSSHLGSSYAVFCLKKKTSLICFRINLGLAQGVQLLYFLQRVPINEGREKVLIVIHECAHAGLMKSFDKGKMRCQPETVPDRAQKV